MYLVEIGFTTNPLSSHKNYRIKTFFFINIISMIAVKSAGTLREELAEALRQNDVEILEKIIDDCEAVCYPELCTELQEARITFSILGGRREG